VSRGSFESAVALDLGLFSSSVNQVYEASLKNRVGKEGVGGAFHSNSGHSSAVSAIARDFRGLD
jgi:hypothetical protein